MSAEPEVVSVIAQNLNSRPCEPDAYQHLKESGLLRHIRWSALVTLAKAAGRPLNLEDFQTIASRSGSVSCANCGKQFEEPMVLLVKNQGDPTLPLVPGLTQAMSAHIVRTNSGNLRFQGATFLLPNENEEMEAKCFCGPLYFNRTRDDGSVAQDPDRRSCLGLAMRAAEEAASAALSEKEKSDGVRAFVPAPLTFSHAEDILRAINAAKQNRDRRRADAQRDVEARREGVRTLFEGAKKVYRYGPQR